MGRSPCCDKVGLKKGPWTPEEDHKLVAFIDQHGHGSWRALPAKAGLQRCGKSCRLRWTNYLRPDIKRGQFSLQEEQTIIQLHALLGNRWSAIATHLPKRTDNEIKNYWNTHLKKRLTKMGIDPVTHKPCSGTLCATAGLSHMAQWESARLEAEARLVRESNKLLSPSLNSKYKASPAPPPCLDVLRAWQAQLTSLSSPSGSANKDQAASAFSSLVMGFSGAGESPTSTLTFPLGGAAGFPATADDVSAMTNMNMNINMNVNMNNIPMLPLNDMSYEAGNAWFSSNEDMQNDDVVGNGFPDFLVGGTNDVVESYGNGTVTGHHGTGFVGEENKNYWNSVLMNLVAINASSSSSVSPPQSGAVF